MRLLFGEDKGVAHWVAERIPHARVRIPYFPPGEVFGPAAAIGVARGDELVAGVVFHNYDPFVRSIEVSCAAASPRWANRRVFSDLLRYPFSQLDCRRITAVTPRRAPPGATSPRKFLEGLGFVREGSIRFGFGDQNAIVYGLLAEDWAAHPLCRGALSRGEEIGPRAAAGS